MKKNHHSKSGGSLRRFCSSLLLIFAIITSGCSASSCSAQQKRVNSPAPVAEISIIPQPGLLIINKGYFEFSRDTKIIAVNGSAIEAGNSLNNLLMERYGFKLEIIQDNSWPNAITFSMDRHQEGAEEGYSLKIEPGSIQIIGNERGMFYGIQSLIQLFPANFNGEARIPSASIQDAPRFRYRGMQLDVSRHFMPVEFVKKYISLISRYKYNFFHWHLTDDQGWRIEIKKYPQLTAIGSKRRETVVGKHYPQNPAQRDRYQPYLGDHIPVEGFYTQEEIRDIVAYARARYVTIVPEIDMPGHSSSALASYPGLGCKKNYPYKVQSTWGAFTDIYCPTEQTFQFIDDVLTEVISLFPDSPYIHIGADEVFTDSWAKSKYVQDLKRANGLSSEREVQSWFINRVARIVDSKGKKIIGWDDMLDVSLPPEATVMSWRSVQNGARAARMKHDVIMAPINFTYFDHPQANASLEPLSIYRSPITLSDVYNFDPVPPELSQEDADYILGGEGCLWTEFMKGPREVEYMMFPRAIALAEVLWSQRENKDFRGFFKRLSRELPKLDREQVNYRGSPQPTTQVFQPDFPETVMPVTVQPQIPAH